MISIRFYTYASKAQKELQNPHSGIFIGEATTPEELLKQFNHAKQYSFFNMFTCGYAYVSDFFAALEALGAFFDDEQENWIWQGKRFEA